MRHLPFLFLAIFNACGSREMPTPLATLPTATPKVWMLHYGRGIEVDTQSYFRFDARRFIEGVIAVKPYQCGVEVWLDRERPIRGDGYYDSDMMMAMGDTHDLVQLYVEADARRVRFRRSKECEDTARWRAHYANWAPDDSEYWRAFAISMGEKASFHYRINH